MVWAGAVRFETCSVPVEWDASSLTIPWCRPIAVGANAWDTMLPTTAAGRVRATVAPVTGMLAPVGALGPLGFAVTWMTNGASRGPPGVRVVVLHRSAPPPVPARAGEAESASRAGVVTDSAARAAQVLGCRRCMDVLPLCEFIG